MPCRLARFPSFKLRLRSKLTLRCSPLEAQLHISYIANDVDDRLLHPKSTLLHIGTSSPLSQPKIELETMTGSLRTTQPIAGLGDLPPITPYSRSVLSYEFRTRGFAQRFNLSHRFRAKVARVINSTCLHSVLLRRRCGLIHASHRNYGVHQGLRDS